MRAKGLAWREGVVEALAVEVTCGRLSYRYISCQGLFGRGGWREYAFSSEPKFTQKNLRYL